MDILVIGSRPATTTVETAEKWDYALILVISSGRGVFARIFMDSDSKRVVATTDRWVLVMPSGHDK